MMRRMSDKKIWNSGKEEDRLRAAVLSAAEEEMNEIDRETEGLSHTFSPRFERKMQDILNEQKNGTSARETGSYLDALRRQDKKKKSRHSFSRSRYVLAAALLMVLVSTAVFASEDVREGLRQLSVQFFSDRVTVESTEPGGAAVRDTESGGMAAASKENDPESFHACKWKTLPEGYKVVEETEIPESHIYNVMYENNKGETIHYSQHDSAEYTINITYDEKDGYRKKIDLGGMEAYSVSNGETNSIFFEKDGYVFTVMSGQSEETMITWIENSGILPK